jgi:predicted Zn-dependent protease
MAQNIRALKHYLVLILCLMVGLQPAVSLARGSGNTVIIRDTEIEDILHSWLDPLLKEAGMDPDSVEIVLVQNPQVNAFVAGGMNIFLYTGLIQKTENPGELIGVMAHELGHIAAGHLISTRGAFERASYESILGMVLGVGAALATGNGQVASAVFTGSSSLATSRFLINSRVQESSADQAALRFLQGANLNPSGLVSFFEKLSSEELLPASQQSAYMRTHPLTRDRISAVEVKATQSPYKDQPFPAAWTEAHARMKAKLAGFISPAQIQWLYEDRDQSIPARYARAIAAYREDRIDVALKGMDDLITAEPSNPYFKELKGQMLVDFGRINEALPYYKDAVEALPASGLIRIAYGHALLESGQDPARMKEAITHLERALQDEPRATRAYRLLATAYGRLGQENMAKINLAEEAILQRRLKDARSMAMAVKETAPQGSREAQQASDILQQIKNLKGEAAEEEQEP